MRKPEERRDCAATAGMKRFGLFSHYLENARTVPAGPFGESTAAIEPENLGIHLRTEFIRRPNSSGDNDRRVKFHHKSGNSNRVW